MNWEAISIFSEIIGVILLIISAIYLAQQVRQNTAMARIGALSTIKIEISKQYGEWALNERASGLLYKMIYQDGRRSDFSDADKQSISFMMLARLYLFDAAYRSFKKDILKESEILPMMNSRMWKLPIFVDSLPTLAMELSQDFVVYVENNLDTLKSIKKRPKTSKSVT